MDGGSLASSIAIASSGLAAIHSSIWLVCSHDDSQVLIRPTCAQL